MQSLKFSRPIDGALFCFDKGYKVFPLAPNSKIPPKGIQWKEWAETASEKKIRDFAIANPTNNWAVYCGASNLLVVDIDNKDKRNGFESIEKLPTLNDSFKVKTPTGGLHVYYKGTNKTTVGILGVGIDTRGIGGYVVAPGSKINESSYEVISNQTIVNTPTWIPPKLQDNSANRLEKPLDQDTECSITEGGRDNELTKWAGLLRHDGLTHDEILATLTVMNENRCNPPLPEEDIKRIAKSTSRYEREDALAIADFTTVDNSLQQIIKCSEIIADQQPKRDWVLQGIYIGSFISLKVARGGVGKSMLSMLEAVSVATGRELTNNKVNKTGAVWIHNAEDPLCELKGRLIALCQEYKIPITSLHNMFLTSGRTTKIKVAIKEKNKIIKNENTINWIKNFIHENHIKVTIFDPLVKMHRVDENVNHEMDVVMEVFAEIAEETKCAIGLIHHSNKASHANKIEHGSINASRGASSVIDASRIAHTIATMTTQDAKRFGINEDKRCWYIRIDDAKANLQPPAEKANWFRKVSVNLDNGDNYGTLRYEQLSNDFVKEYETMSNKDLETAVVMVMKKVNNMPLRELAIKITEHKQLKHLFGEISYRTMQRKIERLLAHEKNIGQYNYKIFLEEYKTSGRQVVCRTLRKMDFLE